MSFLELRTLIITDIDAVKPNDGGKRVAAPVAEGDVHQQRVLEKLIRRRRFAGDFVGKTAAEKTIGIRRVAFQIPETQSGPCGRSFEDAFILANPARFPLGGGDRALAAYALAGDQKKSTFALEHAIEHTDWNVPKYIAEGLRWLAEGNPAPVEPVPQVAVQIVADVAGVAVNVAEVGGNG